MQLSEGEFQFADPDGLDLLHDQLIGSTLRIEINVSAADDFLAFFKFKLELLASVPPDHAADLSVFIFERQINMPRSRPRDS